MLVVVNRVVAPFYHSEGLPGGGKHPDGILVSDPSVVVTGGVLKAICRDQVLYVHRGSISQSESLSYFFAVLDCSRPGCEHPTITFCL